MCGNAICWIYCPLHRYILTVIEVFLKFLHCVPGNAKSGPSVRSALRYIFHHDDDSHCPVCVHANRVKEFLNKGIQDMLRDEGFQFQVCKNPVEEKVRS